jgi:class 3 adenylate cyclase/tetratricopeptide (TPR) repeat protein
LSACVNCAAQVPDGARFCPDCGERTAVRSCPSCGALAERGRFCAECGAAIDGTVAPAAGPFGGPAAASPVAERRVTSVLFGDLVGFTTLSESKDPEEVRELLSGYFAQCRVVIGRYGGAVEKFIGDAVMAVWGVPVAHEDDAERAVRAGLDLVATISAMGEDVGAPGLAMRVGVVTGEVAVTVGATAEGMVAGDAVNTASRVQSVAEPGRVWVDETTRGLSSAAITFEDAGKHALKGKVEPLQLWRAGIVVAEVGGGQRVDGLEAPLTGRDSDLRLVKELFHATEESGRPRLVVLDGDPGVGKSRLAWEFFVYIDGLRTQVRWHRGRCLSYGDGVAFWALAEAFRARLGLLETDSGEAISDRIDETLTGFVPAAGEREWLRPRLAALLGAGLGASFVREDLFTAWTTFLERVGGDEPVVLVIDDAQYADDGLLDFVDHLLATARTGIFVLALARPELLARRHDLGGRRASVIRLDRLDDAAMATLVDGLVAGLPTATRTSLVARAEGVPLFAVETVRALIDRDLVIPRDGRYVPADNVELDLDAIGAPASLQALVAARLDALTADERHVVADASVLGQTFTRDGLAAVSPDSIDLDGVLAGLQRKEILAMQTDRFSAERGQYRFVQSVMRQVAYGTQSRRDRKVRHLAVAGHLATQPDPGDDLAVVIAQHLLDAVDASSPGDSDVTELTGQARGLLERAARRARRLGSPGEALRLFEAAVARTDKPADQARLQLAAAESAGDAGDYQGAISHATQATGLFDSLGLPIEAGIAAAAHARALISLGDNAGGIEIAEPHWQTLIETPGAEPARLRLAEALSNAHTYRGEADASAKYAEQMIRLAEAVDDAEALALALVRMGTYYTMTGAPITGRHLIENSASIAREHHLGERLAHALNNLATIQICRDLPAALDSGREGLEAARRAGVSDQLAYSTANYILALWVAGQLEEARKVLDTIPELIADSGVFEVIAATVEAWLADAQGLRLPDVPEVVESTDYELALAWLGNLELMQARAACQTDVAAAIAERSITHLLASAGIEDDFMHLWPPLVEAAIEAGDYALAERLLQPVTDSATSLVSPAVAAHWHRLRGRLGAARGDDPDQVESELRAGVAGLDAFGAVGQRARAQEDLARWLFDQNRHDDAKPLIQEARATYTDIGASGWLTQLDSWESERKAATADIQVP